MVAARIDKAHPLRVHLRPASAIVSFVGRHGSLGDDDQAMAGMCVPAGASSGRPDVALHVQV